MGLGNVISQAVIEKKSLSNLDWPRVARFASFGYLFAVDIFSSYFTYIFFHSSRDHFFDIGTMD